MTKIDPFTRTPGVAGQAYIDNGIADEIINNFCSEESDKCVYKITGLRGSGKSVEYSKVIRAIKEKKDWLVYTLSAAGDTIETLIAKMNMESFLNSKSETTAISSTASLSGHILSVEGEGSISISRRGKKIAGTVRWICVCISGFRFTLQLPRFDKFIEIWGWAFR